MSVGRLTRYGLPWSNVAPNVMATANITPGRTLEAVRLKLGGVAFTKAMVDLFRIKANGKTCVEASGAQLDKLLAYQGYTVEAAYLDVPLAERKGLTEIDRMVGAWDTSGMSNITMEMAIGAANAPTLQTILEESAQQVDRAGTPLPFQGIMSKLLRYPYNIAAGGQLAFQTPFGRDNAGIIKRLHVFHANMTGAMVKQDGLVIHESLLAENQNEQKRWGLVPQVGMYTLDFMIDGNVRKAFDTRDARSLEWLFTFSAADNGFVLVEYLNALGDL